MSLLPSDLKENFNIVKKLDDRINFNTQNTYLIPISGQDSNSLSYSTQSYSSNNISWNFTPISNDVYMSRLFYVQMDIEYLATGLYPGGIFNQNNPLFARDNTGPRSWGVSLCCSNSVIKLGNFSSSISQRDIVFYLQRYINNDVALDYLSYFPSMPSQYQNWNDWTIYGAGKNSLANYGVTSPGTQQPNGAFFSIPSLVSIQPMVDLLNGSCTQRVIMRWTFPVIDSPMDFLAIKNKARYLGNVSTVNYQMSFENLENSWCNNQNVNPFTSLVATIINTPTLTVNYIKQQPYIPRLNANLYNYETPVVKITEFDQLIDPFVESTITSTVITMGAVPETIIVYIRERQLDWNYTKTEASAVINKISISYDTRNNLLSDLSQQELYHMCKKNGLTDSFLGFSYHTGSVMRMNMGSDINILDSLQGPGTQSNKQMQVTCRFVNTSGIPKRFSLYVIFCSTGVVASYKSGNVISYVNLTTADDVINSPYVEESRNNLYDLERDYYGGISYQDFMKYTTKAKEKLKSAYNKAKPLIDATAPHLLDVAVDKGLPTLFPRAEPYKKEIRQGLKQLTGYGLMQNDRRGNFSTGGKKLTKKDKGKIAKKMLKY